MERVFSLLRLLLFYLYCIQITEHLLVQAAVVTNTNNEDCLNRFTNPVDMTNCNITQLNPYHFGRDSFIKSLDMSNNELFDFPSNGSGFLYHEQLIQYCCINCGITAIYRDTFAGLRQLKSINLSHNHIKTIPAEAFNYNRLQFLFLANNQIHRFNERHELETMQHLMLLDVSANKNFNLYDLSMDFRRLERVHCSNCNLSSVSGQWFSKIARLKKLHLDSNSIDALTEDCFTNNSVLHFLNLNNNPIQELSLTSESLETLSCIKCNISRLTEKNFQQLPSLRVLQLQNNNIQRIDPATFASNTMLRTLLLDNNNLTSFPIEILRTSRALQQLCIDNNYFHPTPNFKQLSDLYKSLQLRKDCAAGQHHHFEKIVPNIEAEGSSLYEKDLPACNSTVSIANRNVIFIDPMAYVACEALTALNMDDNSNFSFHKHYPLLYSESLESYSCESCGIEIIYEDTFSHLKQLRRIFLKNNHLTKIAFEAFDSNTHLNHIDFGGNELQLLPVRLLSLHGNVSTLNLNNNRFLSFTSTVPFIDQPVVETFNAKHCAIRNITSLSFLSMPNLREIYISDNPIQHIDQRAFENNPQLRVLDLSKSHLHVFPVTAIVHLKQLEMFCLTGTSRYEFTNPVLRENNVQLKKWILTKASNCNEEFIQKLPDDIPSSTTSRIELAAIAEFRTSGSDWGCTRSGITGFIITSLHLIKQWVQHSI
ncbi:leucine-rich repeat-containing G-protein coupled receptor 4-like [Wyeomyia smithii]|uniref:leucine-rich repeat-containing G-protein coupled receptor 4-like n=1 Tax=Wyeomyia smithii TaxID=174621 RepID=UPI002467AF09|nr:leucine-rich repeat-containing G-protein coupled receptor 4-like [Wyeomyia smithii]